jgi:hypothetical protein
VTEVWTIMLRDLDVDEPTIAEVGQALKGWLAERGLEAGIVTVDSALLRRALKPPGGVMDVPWARDPRRAGKPRL